MNKDLILTVDVEWFYNGDINGRVDDFSKKSLKERYEYDKGHVEKSINKILQILLLYNQKITFFIAVELEKVYPQVINKIQDAGHEIAIHSYHHDELLEIKEFEKDLLKCESFKKKYHAIGFRSPRIKNNKSTYSILRKYGYKYDSSVYGTRKFEFNDIKILPISIFPYRFEEIQNIPSSLSLNIFIKSLPFGVGFLMFLPINIKKYIYARYYKRYKEPPCIFMHSWQINQPKYTLKFFINYPWMFPYSVECVSSLEEICKNYRLVTIKDYLFN